MQQRRQRAREQVFITKTALKILILNMWQGETLVLWNNVDTVSCCPFSFYIANLAIISAFFFSRIARSISSCEGSSTCALFVVPEAAPADGSTSIASPGCVLFQLAIEAEITAENKNTTSGDFSNRAASNSAR